VASGVRALVFCPLLSVAPSSSNLAFKSASRCLAGLRAAAGGDGASGGPPGDAAGGDGAPPGGATGGGAGSALASWPGAGGVAGDDGAAAREGGVEASDGDCGRKKEGGARERGRGGRTVRDDVPMAAVWGGARRFVHVGARARANDSVRLTSDASSSGLPESKYDRTGAPLPWPRAPPVRRNSSNDL
jgi:hypothetical protein